VNNKFIVDFMEITNKSGVGGFLVCLSVLFLFFSIKYRKEPKFFLIIVPSWLVWSVTVVWFACNYLLLASPMTF